MLRPCRSSASRPRRVTPRTVLLIGLFCGLFSVPCPRSHAADRGRWTPLQDLDPQSTQDLAIHLALMKGDGAPYHSRVLWWGHSGSVGGVLGWLEGNDDCTANPLSTFTTLGSWNPGANIFCGGLTMLADGKLLTVGGTDIAYTWGINDARTFTPGTGQSHGSWAPRAPMRYSRFYPTATTLRDGRALASWGTRYGQLWYYGGRREGAPPAGGTGDLLHRSGRGSGDIWDYPLTPVLANPNERPTPREGHASVSLIVNLKPGMAVFGGRDGNGNTDDHEVWQLHRENGAPLDADYKYQWARVPVANAPPDGRADHVALSLSSSEMVVFGGLRKPTGGSETPLGDFWHLWRNTQTTFWTWSPVQAAGTPPTARYGHAAVYVSSGRKLYVFGGAEQWGQAPSDNRVYVFTFNHPSNSPASGSWSELTVTAGNAPAPRRDHTMVFDATGPSGPALLVYGGHLGGATEDAALWKLDLSQSPAVWSTISTSGTSPGARYGHSATYDDGFNNGRMIIFGGEPALDDPVDAFMYTIEPFNDAQWVRGAAAPARLSGHTASSDPVGTAYARSSEIYDPTADAWTDTNAGWLQRPGLYPLHFLVPGASPPGGGRVLAVGPDSLARFLDIPQAGPPSQGWLPVGGGDSGFLPLTGVMYAPGKVMVAGGRMWNGETVGYDVAGTTKTLDAAGTSGWQSSGSMEPRYHHNLVLLPTGQVLALGGNPTVFLNDYSGVRTPQMWNPTDGTWTSVTPGHPTRLTPDEALRNYHSAAILLPDGRVLSGGGYDDFNLQPYEQTVNIFCPPYLFRADGVTPAPRPTISAWPTNITYGEPFLIGTPTPGAIGSVCLMRPGATTHSFDENQRYVPLAFTSVGPSQLRAVAPAGGSLAPPGDYLLFVLDWSGVPAVAKWIRLGNCPTIPCDADPPPAVVDLYPDIVGPNEIWLAWSAPGDDYPPALGGYDLCFSTSPITTEDAFAAASPVGPPDFPPPTPGPIGSGQSATKFSLAECTSYYFALKTKDGRNNWSAMRPLATGTSCGGGGGGFSAHRVDGDGEGANAVGAAATSPSLADVSAGTASPVSPADAGAESLAGATGLEAAGALVAETDGTSDRGWRVTLRLVAEVEGLGGSVPTEIVSQVGDARGGWTTLGRVRPTPGQSPLGVCALREGGRVAFPAGYTLDRIASGLRSGSQDYTLSLADHSRLGPLGDRFLASGGDVEMTLGDTLTMTYAPSGDAVPAAARWYLLVRSTVIAGSSSTPARRGSVSAIPRRFALHPNKPNPFRLSTTIGFDLLEASPVALEVFDLLGRRVTTLAQGEFPAGVHTVEWNLRDREGSKVRPGVYVYRLEAGEFRAKRKLSVLP